MNLTWYEENNIKVDDSVGIDEVGRGPLAGPTVAAAVWIGEELALQLEQNAALVVRDSKKMSAIQRKKVVAWMESQPRELIRYSIGYATVEEIDRLNILNAALLSMQRAYDALGISKKYALIDGNKAPELKNTKTKTIVKGDGKILSVALASIIAKEHRDTEMHKLAIEYPQYGWETNVGYGSQMHIEAILKYGITLHHRKTFAPIKNMKHLSFQYCSDL